MLAANNAPQFKKLCRAIGRLAAWTTLPSLRTRLFEILHSPDYWLARIEIVRRVMDGLYAVIAQTVGKSAGPVPAAIAGHSFGAYTSQLFAGAEIDIPGRGTRRFRDDRFNAAILLSAQGRDQQGLRERSWAGISGPLLNVTGTLDGGAKGQDWHWKLEPYKFAPPGGEPARAAGGRLLDHTGFPGSLPGGQCRGEIVAGLDRRPRRRLQIAVPSEIADRLTLPAIPA
ncbi:hypothetical protein [Oricola nitratireducens]|uniref:hypothetical protein n=1 Tax=Oricola nitratireducens TaxID=2775868 RepID=UPI00186901EA|nr:hypothetical protein [Oricola nitratireducens]